MKRSKFNEENYDIKIGKRIKDIRQKFGYSQKDIAQKLNISFQQIQKYEKGINRISISRLVSISDALGVYITEFLPEQQGKSMSVNDSELRLLKTLSKYKINIEALNSAFPENINEL